MNNFRKAIIIAGQTASGKSSLALSIMEYLKTAANIDSMIINADSMQIYNKLQKLTAQPTDLNNHYLYGYQNPKADISLMDWMQDLKNILKSNPDKLPIIVGGSGLYIEALEKGIANTPKRNENSIWNTKSLEDCYEEAIKRDINVSNIKDQRRLARLLDLHDQGFTEDISSIEREKIIELNILKVLKTSLDIRENIQSRLKQHIEEYIDEVKNDRDFVVDSNLSKAIGFQQICNYIDNESDDKNELMKEIETKTYQYAKRQNTWFKKRFKSDLTADNLSEIDLKNILSFVQDY